MEFPLIQYISQHLTHPLFLRWTHVWSKSLTPALGIIIIIIIIYQVFVCMFYAKKLSSSQMYLGFFDPIVLFILPFILPNVRFIFQWFSQIHKKKERVAICPIYCLFCNQIMKEFILFLCFQLRVQWGCRSKTCLSWWIWLWRTATTRQRRRPWAWGFFQLLNIFIFKSIDQSTNQFYLYSPYSLILIWLKGEKEGWGRSAKDVVCNRESRRSQNILRPRFLSWLVHDEPSDSSVLSHQKLHEAAVVTLEKQLMDLLQDPHLPQFNDTFGANLQSLKQQMNDSEWKVKPHTHSNSKQYNK